MSWPLLIGMSEGNVKLKILPLTIIPGVENLKRRDTPSVVVISDEEDTAKEEREATDAEKVTDAPP